MKKYLLLSITWLAILAVNIYRTVNGMFDLWLWILFVAIAIIPLADRLKIGELFDFGSKRANKQDKQDIANIANYSAQNLILNVTSASQILKEVPPMPSLDLKNDELTDQDKQVIEFMYNADIALYGLSCAARPLYAALLVRRQKGRLDNARFKELLYSVNTESLRKILETIKRDMSTELNLAIDTKFINNALELLTLRGLVEKDESNLPDKATCKAIVARTLTAVEVLSGLGQAGLSITFNPSILPHVLKQNDKPH